MRSQKAAGDVGVGDLIHYVGTPATIPLVQRLDLYPDHPFVLVTEAQRRPDGEFIQLKIAEPAGERLIVLAPEEFVNVEIPE